MILFKFHRKKTSKKNITNMTKAFLCYLKWKLIHCFSCQNSMRIFYVWYNWSFLKCPDFFRLYLTLSPPNKVPSALILVCYNFQSASMLLKVGENVVCLSNSLDLGKKPIYSASHLDPSYLLMALGCDWRARN